MITKENMDYPAIIEKCFNFMQDPNFQQNIIPLFDSYHQGIIRKFFVDRLNISTTALFNRPISTMTNTINKIAAEILYLSEDNKYLDFWDKLVKTHVHLLRKNTKITITLEELQDIFDVLKPYELDTLEKYYDQKNKSYLAEEWLKVMGPIRNHILNYKQNPAFYHLLADKKNFNDCLSVFGQVTQIKVNNNFFGDPNQKYVPFKLGLPATQSKIVNEAKIRNLILR